jgi:hypothetical protein
MRGRFVEKKSGGAIGPSFPGLKARQLEKWDENMKETMKIIEKKSQPTEAVFFSPW